MTANSTLSDQELDSIMEKIQKLLRLRDHVSASVGEVANAGAMIQQLLLKYNLTMEAIESHQPERKGQNEYQQSDRFDLGASSNYRTEWRSSLLSVVARNNFCRVVVFSRQKKTHWSEAKDAQAVLVGKSYNVQVTKELYEWLTYQVNRLCTKGWTAAHRDGYQNKKVWKTSFFDGAVAEINARLVKQRREAEAADANVHALIVLSDKGLQEAYDSLFPAITVFEYHYFAATPGNRKVCGHVMKAGTPCGRDARSFIHYRERKLRDRVRDYGAYEAGMEAGRNVNLTPTKGIPSRPKTDHRRISDS